MIISCTTAQKNTLSNNDNPGSSVNSRLTLTVRFSSYDEEGLQFNYYGNLSNETYPTAIMTILSDGDMKEKKFIVHIVETPVRECFKSGEITTILIDRELLKNGVMSSWPQIRSDEIIFKR